MAQDASETARVVALRELLPATGAGIYLDTAYRGPLPAETAAAMREADDWELRVGRATEGRAEDMEQRVEEARAVLAALLIADPSEIVLTPGVEHALALAAQMAPVDRLTVVHAVDPDTGLSSLGRVKSEEHDLWFAAEASLLIGVSPLEPAALGAEFVAFAADRWLLGPEQTAALWISPKARELGRWNPQAASGLGRTSVLGLARSVGWLEMYVGSDWVYERTRMLAEWLHDALSAIDGITVATPREMLAGVVSFSVARWTVDQTLDVLRRRVFAIIGGSPDGAWVRASVAWFNTEEELDRFAAAVAEIASHTPESLPHRPPLIVR
ncbi:MAG: aminotransferase class V-fold PLP-dependent enzyme [Chloroflexota bacterium]